MTPEQIDFLRKDDPAWEPTIYEAPPSRYFWLMHTLAAGDVTKLAAVSRANVFRALAFADKAIADAQAQAAALRSSGRHRDE